MTTSRRLLRILESSTVALCLCALASPTGAIDLKKAASTQAAAQIKAGSVVPKARFYFAGLGGYATPNAPELKVSMNRPDALKTEALRVVVRNLGKGTTKTLEFPAGPGALDVYIEPFGVCPDGLQHPDTASTKAKVGRDHLFEVDVYLASQISAAPAAPPASITPHARIAGGITGTRGGGLRGFNPGTPDFGKTFAESYAAAGGGGLECRPGARAVARAGAVVEFDSVVARVGPAGPPGPPATRAPDPPRRMAARARLPASSEVRR